MKTIQLNLPARHSNPSLTVNPSIDQVQATLDGLPLANAHESCQQISQLLYKLNRAPFNAEPRIKIMALIQPLLGDIISALRATYLHAELPLTNKLQKTAKAIRTLLSEIGCGYKIIVQELLEEQQVSGVRSPALPQAIYYALTFSARLLVDCYALYTTEPKHIWLELNQLYLYAEQQQFHEHELNTVGSDKEAQPTSIANAYRRIVMLTLANPYHLMQGEAIKLYDRLINWAKHCTITPLGKKSLPEGKLFIDLTMDNPPLYTPKTPTKIQPAEGRILEISSLLEAIEREIRRLGFESNKASHQHSLAHRMERDMYFRWSEAVGIRRERMSHRKAIERPTRMIFGLTTTHHFVSGKRPFTPEVDELDNQMDSIKMEQSSSSLSLIPEEHAPWHQEERTHKLRLGINQPRKSEFGQKEGTDSRDMWVKVYASSTQAFEELTTREDTEYKPHQCQIININQGGYGLFCTYDSKIPARIGELFGSQSDSDADNWTICSVRWMKISDDNSISLGTRIIADDARAVAIKAVSGIGTGGEYYRALIVPNLDPRKNPTTLITPAAVYDVGSILSVTMDKQIIFAKLIRQLESTSAFSHYQFELVQPPEKEHTPTANQEERKLNKLFR